MFRITHVLSIGPFATPERAEWLLARGVTHVLNVSDTRPIVGRAFRESAWVPLSDFRRIPTDSATEVLSTLHRMANEPDSHVYVHCMAGRQRAPTVLWLYLLACGLGEMEAREINESRSPEACAGYPRLIDPELILHSQQLGLKSFLPLHRGEVLLPFANGEEPERFV